MNFVDKNKTEDFRLIADFIFSKDPSLISSWSVPYLLEHEASSLSWIAGLLDTVIGRVGADGFTKLVPLISFASVCSFLFLVLVSVSLN